MIIIVIILKNCDPSVFHCHLILCNTNACGWTGCVCLCVCFCVCVWITSPSSGFLRDTITVYTRASLAQTKPENETLFLVLSAGIVLAPWGPETCVGSSNSVALLHGAVCWGGKGGKKEQDININKKVEVKKKEKRLERTICPNSKEGGLTGDTIGGKQRWLPCAHACFVVWGRHSTCESWELEVKWAKIEKGRVR